MHRGLEDLKTWTLDEAKTYALMKTREERDLIHSLVDCLTCKRYDEALKLIFCILNSDRPTQAVMTESVDHVAIKEHIVTELEKHATDKALGFCFLGLDCSWNLARKEDSILFWSLIHQIIEERQVEWLSKTTLEAIVFLYELRETQALSARETSTWHHGHLSALENELTFPKSSQLYQSIGCVLYSLGWYAIAYVYFQRAVETVSDEHFKPSLEYNMGCSLFYTGHAQEALELIKNCNFADQKNVASKIMDTVHRQQ
jgi:hypothetical protein